MNEARRRRIVVALDSEGDARTLLRQAVALAADLDAELEGLFVEDEDLLRLCRLPVMEVSLRGGVLRRHDRHQLERELRVMAERARRALEAEAGARRVAWRFQVARGRGSEAVLRAAADADLLAAGRGRRGLERPVATRRQRVPLAVVMDEGPGTERALAVGTRLAGQGLGAPVVLVPESAAADPGRLRQRLETVLGPRAAARLVTYRDGLDGLVECLGGFDADVLVMPEPETPLNAAELERLRSAAGGQVLVVRRGS